MPKRGPSKKGSKPRFLDMLLGIDVEGGKNSAASIEQRSAEEIQAERVKRAISELGYLKRDADIYWLTDEEFHERMRKYANRLGVANPSFSLLSNFWITVVADLITFAPEFRRPRARPKLARGKGGMAYDRYRAVLSFRREHPEQQSTSQVEIIRALKEQGHPLFRNYDEATLIKEVSRGKAIFEKAKAKAFEISRKTEQGE